MTIRSALLCSLLLTLALPAHALRGPTVESAVTPEEGHGLVEFGHRLQYSPQGVRQQVQQLTVSMAPQPGQQADISVPWRVEHATDEDLDFGDISMLYKAGALAQWAEGHGLFGMYQRSIFPTSKASRANGKNYQVELGTLLTQQNEHTLYSINAGSLIQTSGDELMRYGAAFQFMAGRIGGYAEITGLTDFQNNGINEILTSAGGVEVFLSKHVSLDAGAEIGITHDAPNWGVFSGATVVF